ncbi:hypothetical protein FB451DRAFT_1369526 [Mycena latifolia]|nr:hypothetical protein FB451DRAFT_1369526 [Mycena latifolia]
MSHRPTDTKFLQNAVESTNRQFTIITPKETTQLRDLYREMLEEGHDAAELQQGILEHIEYMRKMYMLSKKLCDDAAGAGVRVPQSILDVDEEQEQLEPVHEEYNCAIAYQKRRTLTSTSSNGACHTLNVRQLPTLRSDFDPKPAVERMHAERLRETPVSTSAWAGHGMRSEKRAPEVERARTGARCCCCAGNAGRPACSPGAARLFRRTAATRTRRGGSSRGRIRSACGEELRDERRRTAPLSRRRRRGRPPCDEPCVKVVPGARRREGDREGDGEEEDALLAARRAPVAHMVKRTARRGRTVRMRDSAAWEAHLRELRREDRTDEHAARVASCVARSLYLEGIDNERTRRPRQRLSFRQVRRMGQRTPSALIAAAELVAGSLIYYQLAYSCHRVTVAGWLHEKWEVKRPAAVPTGRRDLKDGMALERVATFPSSIVPARSTCTRSECALDLGRRTDNWSDIRRRASGSQQDNRPARVGCPHLWWEEGEGSGVLEAKEKRHRHILEPVEFDEADLPLPAAVLSRTSWHRGRAAHPSNVWERLQSTGVYAPSDRLQFPRKPLRKAKAWPNARSLRRQEPSDNVRRVSVAPKNACLKVIQACTIKPMRPIDRLSIRPLQGMPQAKDMSVKDVSAYKTPTFDHLRKTLAGGRSPALSPSEPVSELESWLREKYVLRARVGKGGEYCESSVKSLLLKLEISFEDADLGPAHAELDNGAGKKQRPPNGQGKAWGRSY